MEKLNPMEIGVMFWAGADPVASLRQVKEFGVRCGQLGIPGDMPLEGAAGAWRAAAGAEGFTIVTVFAAYEGESYLDIPAIQRTVGFFPPETRQIREARTLQVSDFAAALGVDSIACHVGCIPEDPNDPDRRAVRDIVRRVADHAASHGQRFALETGQETAQALVDFIREVDRPNVRVNFDPANMLLYGTGDPLEAVDLLAPFIISVHCKDGDYPPAWIPGALGPEYPLGHGVVGIERLLAKLAELGYQGTINVEREVDDEQQKREEIAAGVQLLRRLTDGLT